jgi:hypothetical protein
MGIDLSKIQPVGRQNDLIEASSFEGLRHYCTVAQCVVAQTLKLTQRLEIIFLHSITIKIHDHYGPYSELGHRSTAGKMVFRALRTTLQFHNPKGLRRILPLFSSLRCSEAWPPLPHERTVGLQTGS